MLISLPIITNVSIADGKADGNMSCVAADFAISDVDMSFIAPAVAGAGDGAVVAA